MPLVSVSSDRYISLAPPSHTEAAAFIHNRPLAECAGKTQTTGAPLPGQNKSLLVIPQRAPTQAAHSAQTRTNATPKEQRLPIGLICVSDRAMASPAMRVKTFDPCHPQRTRLPPVGPERPTWPSVSEHNSFLSRNKSSCLVRSSGTQNVQRLTRQMNSGGSCVRPLASIQSSKKGADQFKRADQISAS